MIDAVRSRMGVLVADRDVPDETRRVLKAARTRWPVSRCPSICAHAHARRRRRPTPEELESRDRGAAAASSCHVASAERRAARASRDERDVTVTSDSSAVSSIILIGGPLLRAGSERAISARAASSTAPDVGSCSRCSRRCAAWRSSAGSSAIERARGRSSRDAARCPAERASASTPLRRPGVASCGQPNAGRSPTALVQRRWRERSWSEPLVLSGRPAVCMRGDRRRRLDLDASVRSWSPTRLTAYQRARWCSTTPSPRASSIAAGERAGEGAERRAVVALDDQQVLAARRARPRRRSAAPSRPRSRSRARSCAKLTGATSCGSPPTHTARSLPARRVVDAADEVPRERVAVGALADARAPPPLGVRARGSRRCRRSPRAPRSPARRRRRARACRARARPPACASTPPRGRAGRGLDARLSSSSARSSAHAARRRTRIAGPAPSSTLRRGAAAGACARAARPSPRA